jgi:hypothetical protein
MRRATVALQLLSLLAGTAVVAAMSAAVIAIGVLTLRP